MRRDMVVSRYVIPIGIPRFERLSTGLSGFGVSQDPRVRSVENFKQDFQHLRIADLCIPGHKEWDTELLEEIFTLVDAQAIASIPLSSGTQPNAIIWHFNKRGAYTVKSGYKVLRKITRPNSQSIASDAWSKLWAVGFPPKIKQFMWSVCTECLPTRPKLRTKGIPINDACSLCDHPSEAAIYALIFGVPIRQGMLEPSKRITHS